MFNQLTDVIFDGNNLAHRAAHIPGVPQQYNGINTTLLRKFIQMILSNVRQIANVGDIYMVWDKRLNKQAVNFRKQLIDSVYKQNRDHSANDHIFAMIDIVIPILSSMGIRNVFPYSLEGDDVMAWLARHCCHKCVIITADEDLWQLVSDNVSIINPKKGTIATHNFETVSPVPKDKYVLWKCILGDTSDSVKGLAGYGKKRAPELAINFDSTLLSQQQNKRLDLNRQLLDLEYGLTQSPDDIEAFKSQIKYHNAHTKFDKAKFVNLVIAAGIGDVNNSKTITEIQQLSKGRALMDVFGNVGLLQTL